MKKLLELIQTIKDNLPLVKRSTMQAKVAKVKERPISFNEEMIRAYLAGRKTQTRRPIKPQPELSILKEPYRDLQFEFRRMPILGPTHIPEEWGFVAKHDKSECVPIYGYKCPYGRPGDRLWVRETFSLDESDCGPVVFYRATDHETCGQPWKPSIHMPRWASRITLEIIDIRVERLRDITEKDARDEGVRVPDRITALSEMHCAGRVAFRTLWNAIYAKRGLGWESNPWVWVVCFERIGEERKC